MKLWRKTIDSAVFDDDWLFRLWCWCLIRANWRDGQFKGEPVPTGSFVCGRVASASILGVSASKFHRGLHKLEELGQITLKVNCKWTCVSVCNWRTYQSGGDDVRTAGELLVNGERTANELLADTDEECKKGRSKEGKKLRGKPLNNPPRERKRKVAGFVQGMQTLPEQLQSSPKFVEAWQLWLGHRANIRKPYRSPESEQTQLKHFLHWGIERSVAAIAYSVRCGYQGIFEDKSQPAKPTSRVATADDMANYNPVDGGLG